MICRAGNAIGNTSRDELIPVSPPFRLRVDLSVEVKADTFSKIRHIADTHWHHWLIE